MSEFEQKRAEKIVGALATKRRPPPAVREQVDLVFRVVGQSVELYELRADWRGGDAMHEQPVAKATYVKAQGSWKLFWMRSDQKWHRYDPKPMLKELEQVVAEIDADPHGCFWG
ncbi:DUF3024 domain-containing protein [Ottowia sp.]|uniref:DUF3024 domain-containing protein n=1 Tax=Ottowia sp. TaxID=1898956 RepID=UPI003A83B9CA